MRLRLVKEVLDDPEYIFELKHDGFRAVACLANCYAGRFYLLYESELSLTFGTHLVAGKRSDRRSALRLENSERFLGSSADVAGELLFRQPQGM
jgi:hypothetical protein